MPKRTFPLFKCNSAPFKKVFSFSSHWVMLTAVDVDDEEDEDDNPQAATANLANKIGQANGNLMIPDEHSMTQADLCLFQSFS